jgi:hypothetical protein
MIIDGKDILPPFEFWIPDYSDFVLPVKNDGNPYNDPDDYEDYLDWLVMHIDSNDFALNTHHQEIILNKTTKGWDAERLGLWLGCASISEYYSFVEPCFNYPDDYLSNPKPDRICEPSMTTWPSEYFDDDDELKPGMVSLEAYLIFDFMCYQADKIYSVKKANLYHNATIFSDIGWRPLLKQAVSRTSVFEKKRNALKLFHEEYDYLSTK